MTLEGDHPADAHTRLMDLYAAFNARGLTWVRRRVVGS
jgi:hypothetical protein